MKKAVLISMKPKNVELVLNGYETLEIRKTRPRLETPFKCYIYCTAGNLSYEVDGGMVCNVIGGKLVVGEFMCNTILPIQVECSSPAALGAGIEVTGTCLTDRQILEYLGNGKQGYAWHISNLKIYNTPRSLDDFKPWNRDCKYTDLGLAIPKCETCRSCTFKKPPQIWFYVEELKNE